MFDNPELNVRFEQWEMRRELHTNVENAFLPLIKHHYAVAVDQPVDVFKDMTDTKQMSDAFPFTLPPRNPDESTYQSDERLQFFRLAVLYDTMSRVQSETLGGDDSTFDYVPDGALQIQLLCDSESFEWMYVANDASVTIDDFSERFGPYFQDCTSPLLYPVIAIEL